MDTAITTAKNKAYKDMSVAEKIAFVEAVCMRACEHTVKSSSHIRLYFKFWGEAILKMIPSSSAYMDRYFYGVRDGVCVLCVLDDDGEKLDVSNNVKELRLFLFNATNEIPLQSPIVNLVKDGKKKLEIASTGINPKVYASDTDVRPKATDTMSKRQRVLRGELTRYEAYEKPNREKNKLTKKTEE